jgi:molybdenum-dependent DNA-binding transcriptional regulator ModE
MADETKFSKEEMKELNKIQEIYVQTQNGFGQISIARLRLEAQLNEYDVAENKLKQMFLDNQEKEKKFISKVTDKYGEITLDPNTGNFTPNE